MARKPTGKRASRKKHYFIGTTAMIKMFGLTAETLLEYGVIAKRETSGMTWDIEDTVRKCPKLIMKKMTKVVKKSPETKLKSSASDLKDEKVREDIRKIKLQNDLTEGKLVRADEVAQVYSENMRTVSDLLDSIPSRVKMGLPEITPEALSIIQDTLVEIRNKASVLRFDDQEERPEEMNDISVLVKSL